MTAASFFFYIFSLVSVICAIAMVTGRNPVASAMYLVLCLCAIAGIYITLDAHFIGVVQILVYAGAIMVLILFVIMLLNLGRQEEGVARNALTKSIGALLTGVLVVIALGLYHRVGPVEVTAPVASFGAARGVGTLLFTKYLLPFEIASVLLVAAIVGAVMLAKRDI